MTVSAQNHQDPSSMIVKSLLIDRLLRKRVASCRNPEVHHVRETKKARRWAGLPVHLR